MVNGKGPVEYVHCTLFKYHVVGCEQYLHTVKHKPIVMNVIHLKLNMI